MTRLGEQNGEVEIVDTEFNQKSHQKFKLQTLEKKRQKFESNYITLLFVILAKVKLNQMLLQSLDPLSFVNHHCICYCRFFDALYTISKQM